MAQGDWGTVAAHWGDVLCSLALFRERVGEGNIVYYGSMSEIVDFLKVQPYIHEVKWIPDTYGDFSLWWSQETQGWTTKKIERDPKHDWTEIFRDNGIPADKLIRTHLHREWSDGPIIFLDQVHLPKEAKDWAEKFRETLPEDFFILNPFSFASTLYYMHWPHWGELMKMLSVKTPRPFKWVLVGHQWHQKAMNDHPGQCESIIDMVDKIPKMMGLLALTDLSSGMLTTSNSLGHWGAVTSKTTSVICNTRSSLPDYYFRRVLKHPALECWDHSAQLLDGFEAATRIYPYP